jgi:hypothetical protein
MLPRKEHQMANKRKEYPDKGLGSVRGLYEIHQPSGKIGIASPASLATIGPSPEIDRKTARIIAMRAIVAKANDIDRGAILAPALQQPEARNAARGRAVYGQARRGVAWPAFVIDHPANDSCLAR